MNMPEADQPTNETPHFWQLSRDVHSLDTRLTVLETVAVTQAKSLEKLDRTAQETNSTLREVRDSIIGWKSAVAIIVGILGIAGPLLLFVLSRLFPAGAVVP
jgi:hypothetical protein